jgi:hypothetical protein
MTLTPKALVEGWHEDRYGRGFDREAAEAAVARLQDSCCSLALRLNA